MNEIFRKRDIYFILKSFLVWRILIFIPILLAPYFFELQKNFLGGGLEHYLTNPFIWSWANFDGEHYLSIAKIGYANGEQAFFPFYPLLIKFFGGSVFSGIFISNLSFLVALFGLYKLIKLDYDDILAKISIILVLVFPTSFYFGAVYTESLFLCLVIWTFYLFRKRKFTLGLILGSLSSLTRVIGLVPLGVLTYIGYSKYKWNDYLAFFHAAKNFGEQRSDHLILLPQVFYRYIVKIIPNLTWSYFPVVFTTMLEISVATIFLYLIVISFKKLRIEYWLFLLLGYLVPTFSGSFSSLPRYVVVLFPAFIFFAMYLKRINKYLRLGIYLILAIIAIVAQVLFVRGYFVS